MRHSPSTKCPVQLEPTACVVRATKSSREYKNCSSSDSKGDVSSCVKAGTAMFIRFKLALFRCLLDTRRKYDTISNTVKLRSAALAAFILPGKNTMTLPTKFGSC